MTAHVRHRGFTLIELLVVIAIIGVLSTIVLASLSTARTRANDAAVKSNLNAVRTLGQEFYSVQGSYSSVVGGSSYTGDCLTNQSFFRITDLPVGNELRTIADKVATSIEAAYQAGGAVGKQCRLSADRSQYLIIMSLPSGGYWCIDSSGNAKATTTLSSGSSFTC